MRYDATFIGSVVHAKYMCEAMIISTRWFQILCETSLPEFASTYESTDNVELSNMSIDYGESDLQQLIVAWKRETQPTSLCVRYLRGCLVVVSFA